MAYKITEECISCGACAAQCPCEAIAEGDTQYEINADACVDCGACAAQCPVEAIVEGLLRYIQKSPTPCSRRGIFYTYFSV